MVNWRFSPKNSAAFGWGQVMTPDSLYYSVSTIPTRWSRIFVHWWTVPLDHRAIAWNSPFNWVKYKSPGCCACACGCGCRKGCCGSWSRLLWFLLGKWIPSLPLWHFFFFVQFIRKKSSLNIWVVAYGTFGINNNSPVMWPPAPHGVILPR